MNAVGRGDTCRLVTTGEHRCPVIDVLLGVGNHDRRTRRAGRGMDTHDLLFGHSRQTERVDLAQVRLLGKRELPEVVGSAHIGQVDPFELARIEGRAVLQRLELLRDQTELLVGEFHRWSLSRLAHHR